MCNSVVMAVFINMFIDRQFGRLRYGSILSWDCCWTPVYFKFIDQSLRFLITDAIKSRLVVSSLKFSANTCFAVFDSNLLNTIKRPPLEERGVT